MTTAAAAADLPTPFVFFRGAPHPPRCPQASPNLLSTLFGVLYPFGRARPTAFLPSARPCVHGISRFPASPRVRLWGWLRVRARGCAVFYIPSGFSTGRATDVHAGSRGYWFLLDPCVYFRVSLTSSPALFSRHSICSVVPARETKLAPKLVSRKEAFFNSPAGRIFFAAKCTL